jgi:curved DNA-binding protein CbpA
MDQTEDFYDILSVRRDATTKEIVSAYRALSLKCHPDKNQGNELAAAQFVRVSQAYQVLSSEKTRTFYDAYLSAQEAVRERERSMAGKRAEFRASLLSREAEARKQRQRAEETVTNFRAAMERARSEAIKLSQSPNRSARTLRLRWQSSKHLTEAFLIDNLPGIQHVTINAMHTGAEVVFFTVYDCELALQREHAEFKLDSASSELPRTPSERTPFAKYEAQTMERLYQLANITQK